MIEYKNIIKKAPLPFLGQKRFALKPLYDVFKNIKLNDDVIIIDLFGGSGLLANFFKQMYPNNRVVWNDFDNFNVRLEKIQETEEIRQEIALYLKVLTKNRCLTNKEKEDITKILNKKKDLDHITFNTWFGFNSKIVRNNTKVVPEYCNLKKTPLQGKSDYLKGVERVSKDFKIVLDEFKNKNVFWVCDPPYVGTYQNNYKKEISFLDALELVEAVGTSKNKVLYFSAQTNPMSVFIDKQYLLKNSKKIGFNSAIHKINGRNECFYLSNFELED